VDPSPGGKLGGADLGIESYISPQPFISKVKPADRVLSLLMVLAILVLSSGCTSSPGSPSPGPTPTPANIDYSNAGDHFRISIPYDRVVHSTGKNAAPFIPANISPYALPMVVFVTGQNTDITQSVMVIWGLNLTNYGTPQDLGSFQASYLQGALQLLTANGDTNFVTSAPQDSVINGKEALTTYVNFTNAGGLQSTARVTTIQDGQVFYVINYVALTGVYPAEEKAVTEIINSFTIFT
jgi:hypothetical protein